MVTIEITMLMITMQIANFISTKMNTEYSLLSASSRSSSRLLSDTSSFMIPSIFAITSMLISSEGRPDVGESIPNDVLTLLASETQLQGFCMHFTHHADCKENQ